MRSRPAAVMAGYLCPPTTAPAPSVHPGMGAIPFDGGVSFRVWAPNATAVAVVLQDGAEAAFVHDGLAADAVFGLPLPLATTGESSRQRLGIRFEMAEEGGARIGMELPTVTRRIS